MFLTFTFFKEQMPETNQIKQLLAFLFISQQKINDSEAMRFHDTMGDADETISRAW